jgi:hypothetical protein
MKRILLASMLMALSVPAIAIVPSSGPGTAQGPAVGPTMKNSASAAPSASQTPQAYKATQVVKQPAVKPPVVSAEESMKHADDSSGMRRGTMQKVDLANGSFLVYGRPVSFDPKRVKVIDASGKPTSIYALKQGASVRFTLDPADASHKRAAVIYVN